MHSISTLQRWCEWCCTRIVVSTWQTQLLVKVLHMCNGDVGFTVHPDHRRKFYRRSFSLISRLFSTVVARGCLPSGANVCVAAPRPQANQISSAIRVFFRISDIGVWTNFWGPLLFPPFLFPPHFSPLPSHSTPIPSPPLKVGPLNPAGSGGAL